MDAAQLADARVSEPAADSSAPDAEPAASDASDVRDANGIDSGALEDAGELGCASDVTPHTVASASGDANLLVIFDRSGSMTEDWNGVPRYQAASEALSAALAPIQGELSTAGVFFPSAAPGVLCPCDPNNFQHFIPPNGCCLMGSTASCSVSALDQSDQIAWTTGSAFRAALPVQAMPIPAGATPLQTACAVADAALALRPVAATTSVLLLSDGAANCETNIDQVVAYAELWATQGIPTHVVGMASDAMSGDVLARIAQAGSTFTARQVTDSAQLSDALEHVLAESAMSADVCTITLATPAAADLVLIGELHGTEYRAARGTDTWSIASDARHVTLEAELCASTRAGALHSLRFVRGCGAVPSWPPPDLDDDAGL